MRSAKALCVNHVEVDPVVAFVLVAEVRREGDLILSLTKRQRIDVIQPANLATTGPSETRLGRSGDALGVVILGPDQLVVGHEEIAVLRAIVASRHTEARSQLLIDGDGGHPFIAPLIPPIQYDWIVDIHGLRSAKTQGVDLPTLAIQKRVS
jgi:hypothetical protein